MIVPFNKFMFNSSNSLFSIFAIYFSFGCVLRFPFSGAAVFCAMAASAGGGGIGEKEGYSAPKGEHVVRSLGKI